MTRNDIEKEVQRILIEDFEIEEALLTPQASLQKDLHIDSLDFVDIIVSIHETFGVKIPTDDLQKMRTLNDLYQYLEKHTA